MALPPPPQVTSPDVQRRMMVEMLESYDREIQSLEGSINEAEEDLDNTRCVWVCVWGGGHKEGVVDVYCCVWYSVMDLGCRLCQWNPTVM